MCPGESPRCISVSREHALCSPIGLGPCLMWEQAMKQFIWGMGGKGTSCHSPVTSFGNVCSYLTSYKLPYGLIQVKHSSMLSPLLCRQWQNSPCITFTFIRSRIGYFEKEGLPTWKFSKRLAIAFIGRGILSIVPSLVLILRKLCTAFALGLTQGADWFPLSLTPRFLSSSKERMWTFLTKKSWM